MCCHRPCVQLVYFVATQSQTRRNVTTLVDVKVRREEKMGTADVVDEAAVPCCPSEPTRKEQERHQGSSEAEIALHSIMAATQDSFRRQLADMRENLNKVSFCFVLAYIYRSTPFLSWPANRFPLQKIHSPDHAEEVTD